MMKLVKACYKLKYCLQKIFGVQTSDSFYEKLITRYYKIFRCEKAGIKIENKRKRRFILSITSIPSRIDKSWITIESLLRQSYKPDKIILWLAEDEFRNVRLPERLKEQQKRGLEICYCDNLRSYKKFYYTAKKYPNDYIVTADDDIIYTEDMLEILVKTYRKNPGNVVCHRSHYIQKHGGRLRLYNQWIHYEERRHMKEIPSFQNFFTSGAGTLIPIFRLRKEILNRDAFMELVPYADDVWLNFCAWKSGIRTVNTKGICGHLISIERSSDKGLSCINVIYGKNDEQIERVLKYLKVDVNQYL